MNYTKGEPIANLLDFTTPDVGYEDEKKRDVCGCCGTYYVVGVGELSELKEIVTELYEALKKHQTHLVNRPAKTEELWQLLTDTNKALAKAEGR